MFKNYLTVAIRNLKRHKLYSAINILGLAVGMTSSILILLYIQNELRYDHHHEHADRIYKVLKGVQTREKTVSFQTCTSGK